MAIYWFGNMHMKKFDDVEEIILRIELRFTMKRPKSLLANAQKHFQGDVWNRPLDVTRINTLVPKSFVKVAVVLELCKYTNKQVSHIC